LAAVIVIKASRQAMGVLLKHICQVFQEEEDGNILFKVTANVSPTEVK